MHRVSTQPAFVKLDTKLANNKIIRAMMSWTTMSGCLRSCYSKCISHYLNTELAGMCVLFHGSYNVWFCTAVLPFWAGSSVQWHSRTLLGWLPWKQKRALHPIRFSQLSASSFSLWIWLPLERKLWCVVTPTTECILPQLSTGSTLFFFLSLWGTTPLWARDIEARGRNDRENGRSSRGGVEESDW